MKIIEFNEPHRRKHFEFFRQMNHPHFSICAPVDITNLLAEIKQNNLPFMPTIVWLVSKVGNEFPEFRQRLREDLVVEHEVVHPSFAISTEASDVFSFCEVKFDASYPVFLKRALEAIVRLQANPSFEDEHGRDDYLFLSSLPWVSFTAIEHAMSFHPHDSVPRIVWGKYFEENGKVKMPLSVQAHHALVDGRHAGLFFQRFEQLCGNVEWLERNVI
ncbi:MAG: chloramphenicol acetyltransferase [Bacteroidota bacterium]